MIKKWRDLLNNIEKHLVDGLSIFIFTNQNKFKPGRPRQTILVQANGSHIVNIVWNKRWII
ncbi:hypothetical protein [Spiroplasma endosymbiont of Polydrusus formosus]|uniref:hypothetical protein n=1 Tax=Spiroplasma endosymbiont of Polydrusus formosus TaxID=3139326 RepID=UPI0035B51902